MARLAQDDRLSKPSFVGGGNIAINTVADVNAVFWRNAQMMSGIQENGGIRFAFADNRRKDDGFKTPREFKLL